MADGGRQLRGLTGDQLVRALRREGWYIFNQRGSHVELRHDEHSGRKVTDPVHKGRSIKIATVYSIMRQAELNAEQLRGLL
ncbi:MAG: addiction module toxin, HicA family [Dehalococcoidia bacterium]|nr:addiction module toxin, HicA family [Dehalococcoidia bacterium]